MEFNNNGSSALLTVLLISILMSITVFGFIILVSNWDERATFRSDEVNLTGIDYNSVAYNATNSTMHGLAESAPGLIWIILIFLVIILITLLAIALKGH